ncbi:MAG: zinc ribbon domain-containing protein [Nitrososphaerales archaeon]
MASSSHYQLRQMLAYKAPTSGRRYVEVDPKYSTMTCSACGCISGPTGLAGLSVRGWCCVDCGMSHDRDVNAAINTLVLGAGTAHELCRPAA